MNIAWLVKILRITKKYVRRPQIKAINLPISDYLHEPINNINILFYLTTNAQENDPRL